MVAKAKEGSTKGHLAEMRVAISVYNADTEGGYPTDDLSSLTVNSKYLQAIPAAFVPIRFGPSGTVWSPGHETSNLVTLADNISITTVTDVGGWVYVNDQASVAFGHLSVNCKHQDRNGNMWFLY